MATKTKYTVICHDQESNKYTEVIGIFNSWEAAENKIIKLIKSQYDSAMNTENGKHDIICGIEECGDDEDRFQGVNLETFLWEDILPIIKRELESGEVDDLEYNDRYIIRTSKSKK